MSCTTLTRNASTRQSTHPQRNTKTTVASGRIGDGTRRYLGSVVILFRNESIQDISRYGISCFEEPHCIQHRVRNILHFGSILDILKRMIPLNPISSLAKMDIRLAMNRGSSPDSSIQASQYNAPLTSLARIDLMNALAWS